MHCEPFWLEVFNSLFVTLRSPRKTFRMAPQRAGAVYQSIADIMPSANLDHVISLYGTEDTTFEVVDRISELAEFVKDRSNAVKVGDCIPRVSMLC